MDFNPFENIKNFLEQYSESNGLDRPDIRVFSRDTDCPALPICESIGAARKSCTKDSTSPSGKNIEACFSSLILLISRVTGLWTKEFAAHVEERRKIGFLDR
jgi:hypothetical protein